MNKNFFKYDGITMIALVITIIIMLILVVVSITVALNGGLFNIAKNAKVNTEKEIDAEQELASGKIKIGEKSYSSIDEYIKENSTQSEKKLYAKPVEQERRNNRKLLY